MNLNAQERSLVVLRFNVENIPAELRERPQWCFCGNDKVPHFLKADQVEVASSTDPATWMPFSECAEFAAIHGLYIGYVLSEDDPYVCIDLDVVDGERQAAKGQTIDQSKWTTQEEIAAYYRIVQAFSSYSEKSASGKGVHIWIRALSGKGRRRGGVEIYGRQRFMICTGDVYVSAPIKERIDNETTAQDILNWLLEEMPEQNSVELEEIRPEYSDEEIWQKAQGAENSAKFQDLCDGRWKQYGYPSQSEADLALMSIFTFYSKSNEQCRRMFRQTNLGQREKANKNDKYLNYTLRQIRGRQAKEKEYAEHGERVAKELLRKLSPVDTLVKDLEQGEQELPIEHRLATMLPIEQAPELELQWPPGLSGQIAYYIYQAAPRPVREMAIVAALGLLAGICGKAFCLPRPTSGLNLYLILIAQSGQGKEGISTGLSSLIGALMKKYPNAQSFIDFGFYASGPALLKEVAGNSSFVNVVGEYGRILTRLGNEDGRDGPMQQLRTVMTDLYQKSGPSSIVGGIKYSSKDRNLQSVQGVNYSLLGETNPESFYKALTPGMMSDGFLSRFLLIEYNGTRPPLNENAIDQPGQTLTDAMVRLCTHAGDLLNRRLQQPLAYSTEAYEIIRNFNVECDDNVNANKDESRRQMWNRAALKMMRVAGLLAIADNYIVPTIQEIHVKWALELIRRDIAIMTRHLNEGDIGDSDDTREKKIIAICREYYSNQSLSNSYHISPQLRSEGLIPRRYLQQRTASLSPFANHRLGSTTALNSAIKNLVENGYMMEVTDFEVLKKFNARGKFYRLLEAYH
jgi:hypothetical protein